MSRHLTLLLCTLTLLAGCSPNPERSSMTSPTAPSAAAPGSLLGPTSVAPGGVSGKFDVSFPPRNDSFDFRNQLEAKYQTGLGRAAAPTFVDREGEVVWTQEYMRYRVNGCDHGSATQRVMAQIDGQPAGQVCGAPPDGLIAFPPRTDAFDFRRQLESKYQQFGRGASQSSVDAEGGVVWTQEYLRYRVNQCDHSTAVQKVFSQIDGGAVTATCFVAPCMFTVSPATDYGPGRRWHLHRDRQQGVGRLQLHGGKPQLFRVAGERNHRLGYGHDIDLQRRAEHRESKERVDSRSLDEQLDAVRDQPGVVHRRVHPDRSAKQHGTDDHLFDQNGGDTMPVDGDGTCDGDRNVFVGRHLPVRRPGLARPERHQSDLHVQSDLRRGRIDGRRHRGNVERDVDGDRCERHDHRPVGNRPANRH